MTGGAEGYIGADHDLVTNEDLPIVHQHQIEIGIEVFSNMNMLTVGHMHRRLEEEPFAAATQNVSHDRLSACVLSGMGIIILEHHFLAVIPLFLELSFLLDINGIGMTMFIEQHTADNSVTQMHTVVRVCFF